VGILSSAIIIAGPPIVCDFTRDSEELEEAKKRLNGHDIEIWQDARIVAYLVPDRLRNRATV
jgi:hypothetical protein